MVSCRCGGEGQDVASWTKKGVMLQSCQTQFLGCRKVKLASFPSPASSQPNPHYFYKHPPPARGPDSAIARDLHWLSFVAEQWSPSYRCCLLLSGSVQGSSEPKAKARSIFTVIPWGQCLFCPMGLLILEKQQQFTVVWGTGVSPFGKVAEKPQLISAGVGEESIHLFPFYRPCFAPLPAAPCLAGLTPAASGFVGLCLCARADTFQQAATQTQTSKGWHVCFLKQLSSFYWAIKYSDEDIKTKL